MELIWPFNIDLIIQKSLLLVVNITKCYKINTKAQPKNMSINCEQLNWLNGFRVILKIDIDIRSKYLNIESQQK